MKYSFKRFLALALAFVMVAGMLPSHRASAITNGSVTIIDNREEPKKNATTSTTTQNVATETDGNVAKVATLDELIEALAADNKLPIVITAQIVIGAGETVTIDLNGKTVNAAWNGTSTTNHIYALSNKGDLTITDSKGNGSINFANAFCLATRTGGSVFGKVGAFEKGYTFNALVIDHVEDAVEDTTR